MSRNMIIAIIVALVVVLALFLLFPQGRGDPEGLPPHATTE